MLLGTTPSKPLRYGRRERSGLNLEARLKFVNANFCIIRFTRNPHELYVKILYFTLQHRVKQDRFSGPDPKIKVIGPQSFGAA